MNGFLGPEVVPDEPGRAAGPAWPAGLAWAPGGLPWLAWLAICLAGSGRQQQRGSPPGGQARPAGQAGPAARPGLVWDHFGAQKAIYCEFLTKFGEIS